MLWRYHSRRLRLDILQLGPRHMRPWLAAVAHLKLTRWLLYCFPLGFFRFV